MHLYLFLLKSLFYKWINSLQIPYNKIRYNIADEIDRMTLALHKNDLHNSDDKYNSDPEMDK